MTELNREELQVAGGVIPLYSVYDVDEDGVSIVVVPSIFGVNDVLEAHMVELAGTRARVLAYDPFWRE